MRITLALAAFIAITCGQLSPAFAAEMFLVNWQSPYNEAITIKLNGKEVGKTTPPQSVIGSYITLTADPTSGLKHGSNVVVVEYKVLKSPETYGIDHFNVEVRLQTDPKNAKSFRQILKLDGPQDTEPAGTQGSKQGSFMLP